MRCLPALTVLLFVAARGGSAAAIPAPLSSQQLDRRANLVIEGLVVSVAYLAQDTVGNYVVARYRADVRVTRVLKGKGSIGAIVPMPFITETWVGKGHRPIGRTPLTTYAACEQVRLYLRAQGKSYSLAGWTGKQTIHLSVLSPLPEKPGARVRCVQGRAR